MPIWTRATAGIQNALMLKALDTHAEKMLRAVNNQIRVFKEYNVVISHLIITLRNY